MYSLAFLFLLVFYYVSPYAVFLKSCLVCRYKDTLQSLELTETTLTRFEKFRKVDGKPVDIATLKPLFASGKRDLLSLEDIVAQSKPLLKVNQPATAGGAGNVGALGARSAAFTLT